MLLAFGAMAAHTQAKSTASTNPDLRFLDGMIAHHQAAVDEAERSSRRPAARR
jgi:uncharacterized protein (DUF305 family)